MPKLLRRTQFGNPILRTLTKELSKKEITSSDIQHLIQNMRHTLKNRKFGVGLAATQVGKSVAVAIIGIKPTPNRPDVEPFESIIINPSFEGVGEKNDEWEACISFSARGEGMYAKVPRYRKIIASWADEKGVIHREQLEGLPSQVFQHETDHLKGVLFVDRVVDSKSWMTASEYRKQIVLPKLKD